MATYEKLHYDIPPYQEGNESDLQIELDDSFPIESIRDITFQVKNQIGEVLLSKRLSLNTIAFENSLITIPLPPSDTKGRPGFHIYEIDFINQGYNPFITMGGLFTISKEVNTL